MSSARTHLNQIDAEEQPSPSKEGLPSTSLVIPTYNRVALLRDLLAPLLADPFPVEIVVVVDGSRDGSIELLHQMADGDPRLIPIWIENSGAAIALETGVKAASGDLILQLDDDLRCYPGLARGHARWHAGQERLLVVGYMPTVVPDERAPGRFASYLYAREYENLCTRYEADPASILASLWSGNLSFRRCDALAVGIANPDFPERYHEDADLGLRFLKAGVVGKFDRGLRADHFHSRSLESFRRDARAEGAGRRRLHELHADVLGPLPVDQFDRGLPAPLRATVRACSRPRIHRLASWTLVSVIRLSTRAGLIKLETTAARLLRRVEQFHGCSSVELAHTAPRVNL